MSQGAAARDVPLCVDLDGTLLRTDVSVESALELLRSNPLWLAAFPLWLLGGRPRLKREVARRARLDAASLPLREDLVAWLRAEKAAGRRLVLVTASDELLARAVAERLHLFDEVWGSDGERNLKGGRKAQALAERFGERGFDYAGDSRADLAVWRRARAAVLVGATAGLESAARAQGEVAKSFPAAGRRWRLAVEAARPHQWAKNLIILVPAITSHRIAEPAVLGRALLAVASFSLCASSVYLLNDLFDLPADRRHARKRARPLAAGELPLTWALAGAAALLAGAAALAALLPAAFGAVLAGYFLLTAAYTLRLRAVALVDVFALALLYTVRLAAGHAVGPIPYSPWLTAFCLFLFLSLALMKRYTEFREEAPAAADDARRGYEPSDAPLLKEMGVSSAYLSALVLALYIQSEQVTRLYRRPAWLWAAVPLLLFGVSRLWAQAHRGVMHDDPVRHVLKDRWSYVLAALVALSLLAARGG